MSAVKGVYDPIQWQKIRRFAQLGPQECNRAIVGAIQKGVKRTSSEQNQQAPRRTGKMASETTSIMETNGASAVSKMFYSVFVDQGTYRMAARPFFTDPMKKNMPLIANEVNTAFAMAIKKFFV